ncbi:nuclear transport factor 2 family protein [Rhodopila sp.]|jgi:hypothetical protein|uniref:nuclear transport factor 2 family protein n=1 Tax=Rhodopila sp. TaxID=2480087 RepID=UPI002B922E3C|nr:nuclear transport factor 2 family protein [Rhodopila sp.]HVZ06313.1 nuclear transport factor 2 family protein [Rhodopila sp.]
MTLSRRRLAAATAMLCGTALAASNAASAATDEASVANAVEAYRKAIFTRDKAALEAMVLPQLSYGHSSGKVQNRQEFVAGATDPKTTQKSLEFSNTWNSVVGDNAISRFIWTGESESEGKATQIRIGVMIVWKNQGGAWKMLARQAYKL